MADTKRKYEAKETDSVSQTKKMQKVEPAPTTASRSTSTDLSAPLKPFSTNPAFLVAMLHTPVETLKPVSNVILVAQRTDLLTDVWKGLVRNNFLSCPVLQQTKKRYYGFVDIHDIVDYITKKFDANKLETAKGFPFFLTLSHHSFSFLFFFPILFLLPHHLPLCRLLGSYGSRQRVPEHHCKRRHSYVAVLPLLFFFFAEQKFLL
jgi:hypothetical protein